MRIFFSLLFLLIISIPLAKAQDTLPGFTTSLKPNGKVLISWRNTYPSVKQISLQRSADSLRNFTTFLTVPDPSVDENGFVDSRAGSAKMYYRIFILFPNSKYSFTKSKRAYVNPVDQPLTAATMKPPREKPKPAEATVKQAAPAVLPETRSTTSSGKPATTDILPATVAAAKPAVRLAIIPPATSTSTLPPATGMTKPPEPALANAEKPVANADKPVANKPAVTDKAVADKPVSDKPAVKKSNSEKPKIVAEEKAIPVAEKPALPAEEKYLIFPKIDNARIFYMMDNSNAKKPSVTGQGKIRAPTIIIEKILFVKRRDSLIMQLSANKVRRFSDSLVKQTRDTLLFVNADTLQINPFIEIYKLPREIYKASVFVFTARDGNINIFLKDAAVKNYHVAFFETDDTPLMEINNIKDGELIIDKTNFGHSGWFKYELYEDGKLKEKNRLLIPRD